MELVAAGRLLTRGLVMMEKLTENSSPQISGLEVTYNSYSGMTLIKFESLHGEATKMSTLKIVGWGLFATFIILLAIPITKAIIKILKICNKRTNQYNLDNNTAEEPMNQDKYMVKFKPHIPHMLENESVTKNIDQHQYLGSSCNIKNGQQEGRMVTQHPEDQNQMVTIS